MAEEVPAALDGASDVAAAEDDASADEEGAADVATDEDGMLLVTAAALEEGAALPEDTVAEVAAALDEDAPGADVAACDEETSALEDGTWLDDTPTLLVAADDGRAEVAAVELAIIDEVAAARLDEDVVAGGGLPTTRPLSSM